MNLLAVLLAVLSLWDYPARQSGHERLRAELVAAMRADDGVRRVEACKRGVALFPDDPVWQYNLACSYAVYHRDDAALDALERAIDLGFRESKTIAADRDFRELRKNRRFQELLAYADELKPRAILLGPLANVPVSVRAGKGVMLGEQNLSWNFDVGCFEAHLKVEGSPTPEAPYAGLLYMNRDGGHSALAVQDFPGLTSVRLDADGRQRGMDLDIPNMRFPQPLFGNASRAFTHKTLWRSLPRMLMTMESRRLGTMAALYLSNQIWVFPANEDLPPVGTHGDVFTSVAPYWIVTEGRSFSDQYYLRSALEATRAIPADVRGEIVKCGLLAPTLQALLRRSLLSVSNSADYMTARAHPTAFPPYGLDMKRLKASAAALTVAAIPPLAVITVTADPPAVKPPWPEATYASACAWAWILRSPDAERTFRLSARGGEEYAFAVVRGATPSVSLVRDAPSRATLKLPRAVLSPTNRVDVAVFARRKGTDWGAPSYVSFSALDACAPYSDPVLAPQPSAPKKP